MTYMHDVCKRPASDLETHVHQNEGMEKVTPCKWKFEKKVE